jgi:hypothetical protein
MSAAATNPTVWPDLKHLAAALAQMPTSELPWALGQLRELEATAMARLCSGAQAAVREPEQLLDVEEAAKRLNTSTDYLYRHWKKLPFACKLPFGLRFSESGLNAYIRSLE